MTKNKKNKKSYGELLKEKADIVFSYLSDEDKEAVFSLLLNSLDVLEKEEMPEEEKETAAETKKDSEENNKEASSDSDRIKGLEETVYLLYERIRDMQDALDSQMEELKKKEEKEIEKEISDLKKEYPEFEAEKEMEENSLFLELLKAGLSVKNAYEASHLEDIKRKSEKKAKNTAGVRPHENGASKKSGMALKSGVYSFTKKDREEMAKRAEKGETIRL